MTAAPILLDLVVPRTKVNLGMFSFDPVAQLLGRPLRDVLEPHCAEPPTTRETAIGPHDVFRVSVAPGDGVSVSFGALGELGLGNQGGLLVITTPSAAALVLRPQLQHRLVHEDRQGRPGAVDVLRLVCRVTRGDRVAIPLGRAGELGVEVA
ncbi:hypothetical protein L6R49_12685 [Myxococcota bacterium]|nr:hypothetical protein [Myxococcota bacterium]